MIVAYITEYTCTRKANKKELHVQSQSKFQNFIYSVCLIKYTGKTVDGFGFTKFDRKPRWMLVEIFKNDRPSE